MRSAGFIALALGFAFAVAAGSQASAQVTVYGELSASKLTNLENTHVLVGPTVGANVAFVDKFHVNFGLDLRGSFLGGSRRLDQISIGPRIKGKVHGFNPYAEFLVGYARYNDGLGNRASGTTDGQFNIVLGLDRRLNDHIDLRLFDYDYEQYYALGGQFNPKTFSTGVVYHFKDR